MVVIQWEQQGVTYHLSGHNMDGSRVVQVARSVEPAATTAP